MIKKGKKINGVQTFIETTEKEEVIKLEELEEQIDNLTVLIEKYQESKAELVAKKAEILKL